jgi:hypothetical protein
VVRLHPSDLLHRLLTGLLGSAAAAGNIAAGSPFSILQSAAAGGAGAALVNGVVPGTTTAVAIAATAPGLIKAIKEGKKEVTIDDVTYKLDDEHVQALVDAYETTEKGKQKDE